MVKGKHYVLGADFGSDSVRVVVIDSSNGELAGAAVSYYPRWRQGLYCNPRLNQFRQHPSDHIESFVAAVHEVSEVCPEALPKVRGICIDTTGSTPALCDADGMPLALDVRYQDDPDAMFYLWKDHTSIKEAADFNELCHSWGGADYTKYMGGTYSSEWFWAKILHIARHRNDLAVIAAGAVEHCDWFPALLTGTTSPERIKRSRCAAGHKIAWHTSWGGYPAKEFLDELHPFLGKVRTFLGAETFTSDQIAGRLTVEWSTRLGLPTEIPVCVGAYDAHIGAVGGHVAEGVLVKSIGTSTCDIIIGPYPPTGEKEKPVVGIAGQVDGSVVPGCIGYEAGQSAYGDYYAWFRNLLAWPMQHMDLPLSGDVRQSIEKNMLSHLEKAAEEIEPSESSPIALDWINGRRTPFADQSLKGMFSGLTLGTDAPAIMRMLLESTAFGARAILECFENEGVKVDKIVAIGGVARKSLIGMQILSDVTGRTIHVTSNDQAPAIGAAAFASVAAGLYPDIPSAQNSLCASLGRVHEPNPKFKAVYDALYQRYLALGAFEETQRSAI